MNTSSHSARLPFAIMAIATTLALAAPAARAVPVSMTLGELPAGLTMTALVSRSICVNGQPRQQSAGSFALAESSRLVYDVVPAPGGGVMLRQRVIITYSGQAADISAAVSDPNQRCPFGEALTFTAAVSGANSAGQPRLRILSTLGSAPAPTTAQNVSANIQGVSTGLPAARDLSRNQLVTFTINHQNPFGAGLTQLPVLEFSRPGPLIGGASIGGFQLFPPKTRLFIDGSGARCITAASVTKCSNNTTLQAGRLVHGGVELVVANTQHHDFNTTFQFELNNDFPVGSYTVKGFADDNDLIDYLVDGAPTSMDLIKWVPTVSTMNVL